MNYEAVPSELKQRLQWVTWRFETDPAHPEKPKKVPYNPKTGRRAESTNAQTWTDFAAAVAAARQRQHNGIGFVFAKDDPYTGIDLDDCLIDGQLAAWAAEIVDTMQSYTEISPSGQGLKIWVEGSVPSAVKTAQIEIYSQSRYFTVTGQRYDSAPLTIRNVNGALTSLYERLRPPVIEEAPALTTRTIDDDYLSLWAERIIDQACSMLALESDGNLHNKRIDMGRWVGGLIPLGVAAADDLERRLYNARIPKSHHADERKAIRNGIEIGRGQPLEPPPEPPQPLFDSEGFACCPIHKVRLPAAKNGNGYKCHQRDGSGFCSFWWKGANYTQPAEATQNDEPAIGVPDMPQPERPHAGQVVLYRLADLRNLPPTTWLIPNEIPAGMLTVVCGPSEAGKSFLMVDYAMRVARAFPNRAVVYVAPEGGGGYRKRIDAWLLHYGGEEPENLVFVLQAIPLLNPLPVQMLISATRSLLPLLVVIDTLARNMVGGDENSAKDMGLFVSGCDTVRQETGAAVAVVHHSGKSGTYRGSSALFAASDSWVDFANDDGLITVSCGKAKDWKPFTPRYLRLVEKGESCILLPSDQVTTQGAMTEGQRKTLEALAMDVFTEPGAKLRELVAITSVSEPTMFRVLSRLKRAGHVSQSKRGDPYHITVMGLGAIKSYHRDRRQQERELSGSQDTITEPPDSTTTNYHSITTTTPVRGSDRYESRHDSPEGESATPTDKHPYGPDWEYLRVCYRTKDTASIRRHCEIHGVSADDILAQLESEAAR